MIFRPTPQSAETDEKPSTGFGQGLLLSFNSQIQQFCDHSSTSKDREQYVMNFPLPALKIFDVIGQMNYHGTSLTGVVFMVFYIPK